jgi:hypothetical protein
MAKDNSVFALILLSITLAVFAYAWRTAGNVPQPSCSLETSDVVAAYELGFESAKQEAAKAFMRILSTHCSKENGSTIIVGDKQFVCYPLRELPKEYFKPESSSPSTR